MEKIDRIRNRYFRWLLKKIDYESVKNSGRDYLYLLRSLFEREFYWDVPHDNNRLADGLHLRIEGGFTEYNLGPCSMLEMMIALAQRIDKEIVTDYNLPKWFWVMIDNSGLCKYDNNNWDPESVKYIQSLILFRGYGKDGNGGLWPLKNAQKDQRTVEIWYQMHAFILENYEI